MAELPVENAQVTLYLNGVQFAQGNANFIGEVTLTGIPDGSYTVNVTEESCYPQNDLPISVNGGNTSLGVTMVLLPNCLGLSGVFSHL